MREGLGHDTALRLLLQAVVADRGRGVQAFLGIARFEQICVHTSSALRSTTEMN